MSNIHDSKLSLEYLVRLPAVPSTKPPVLILLHGYGANEQDLFSLASMLPEELLLVCARAPKTLGVGQYAWFDIDYSTGKPVGNMEQAEIARTKVKHFVDEIIEYFHADTSRVFLGGFSQGAMLSFSVGLTFPGLLAGILPMSGRIVPEVQQKITKENAPKQLPVFLAHGTLDQVIPVRYAHDAREYLRELGVRTEYHEYPIAHTISSEEVVAVSNWLGKMLRTLPQK